MLLPVETHEGGTGGRRLPMFPLSTVLFPFAPLPLHVFEQRYRAMTEECMAGDREFGVVLIERGSEVGGGDVRVPVGTLARIEEAARLEDGRWVMVVEGRRRIRVAEWLPDDPYPVATVKEFDTGAGGEPEVPAALLDEARTAVRRSRALMSELGRAAPFDERSSPAEDQGEGAPAEAPEVVAWRLCAAAPLTELDRQRLLVESSAAARLTMLTTLCDEVADDVRRMLSGG
jgi:Lon protease-like protein